MLSYTDLTKGVLFIYEGAPYEVLETHFLRMQQRKAVVQTRIRNLMTGKLLDRNFQASDTFEEAEIEKRKASFIYKKPGRGADAVDEYWFNEKGNPASRFAISGELLGGGGQFLKPNTEVETVVFKEKVIKVALPIKMEFKVVEAPPAIKGNTAQGGTKVVELEGGAKISAPLFINQGDLVRINTETGEYVERVEKK
ncbi:MAG: hypothetical protein KGJ89_02000 [Patescibacteria group bacterium]|nr:hypothetical protein [Patescibacteria group bacterium]MDE2015649.1 hypothetical protein [Patescibacteria group bacterium]MDE2226706.1 hypothetical protein [Patescibacteria group bacterium]